MLRMYPFTFYQVGFSFLSTLRNNPHITQPKFLFMTGGVELDKNLLAQIQQNTDGLLQKPFKDEILFQKIQEMFPDKIYEKASKLKD